MPIRLNGPVAGDKMLPLAQRLRRAGSKPVHIEGKPEGGGAWELLQNGTRYEELRAAAQLANRSGALNELEFSEFVSGVQQFADALDAAPEFPDMKQRGHVQHPRPVEVDDQLAAERVFVRMLGDREAAQIAQHHQNMLIDREHVVQVVLHLPDDAPEIQQITPEHARLVHQPERMLKTRVITAIVLLAVFLPVTLFAPVGAFGALIAFVVVFAAWEWARLLKLGGAGPVLYALVAALGLVTSTRVGIGTEPARPFFQAASIFWVIAGPFVLLRKPVLAQGAWRAFLFLAGIVGFIACWHGIYARGHRPAVRR